MSATPDKCCKEETTFIKLKAMPMVNNVLSRPIAVTSLLPNGRVWNVGLFFKPSAYKQPISLNFIGSEGNNTFGRRKHTLHTIILALFLFYQKKEERWKCGLLFFFLYHHYCDTILFHSVSLAVFWAVSFVIMDRVPQKRSTAACVSISYVPPRNNIS